jgi:hypothetical protein
MKNVVPMRRPNPSLHNYQHRYSINELEVPLVGIVSVFSWIVLAMYFGVIILGVFAVVSVAGIGIGSFKHYKQPSPMLSCVPSRESRIPEIQQQIRRAA